MSDTGILIKSMEQELYFTKKEIFMLGFGEKERKKD
jgi:hypothetical protein